MARRPKKVLTPEEIAEERKVLRERYFIFAHIGGLMIIISSINPFFAPNQIAGGLILMGCVVYDRWKSASKAQKRMLAYGSLLCTFFIGFNALFQWYLPETLTDTSPGLRPTFISREQTITFGYIGHMIAMFGIFMAIMEIRLMRSAS